MPETYRLKNFILLFPLFFLILTLPACFKMEKPYPVKQYFVIEANHKKTLKNTSDVTIRIRPFEISPLFSLKSFVYKTEKLEYKTDFYNEFFIQPERMVTAQAVEWFTKSGLFRRITPDAGEKCDYILEGNIVNLYVDKTSTPEKAVFEASFFLVSEEKGSNPVRWHGSIKEAVPVSEKDSSPAMAAAFSTALENILVYLEKNLAASVTLEK